MTTFQAIPERDREQYREILRYAFSPQRGPLSEESEPDPGADLFDPRGLYVDGELVSTCKLYSLDAWVREGVERIGGLGAVATPPEHRRRGYIRTLCRHALSEFEANGAGLVTLWPFETAFYANLGWATANNVTRYECHPRVLPSYEASGQFSRLSVDDWQRLQRTERAYGEGVGLSLRRSEQWWRERTLTNWTGGTQPHLYGYERDGQIAGFLTYTVADDEHETLTVETLAHADEEAYRAILSFLGTHGAQIERVVFTRPEESELLARVSEPEQLDCEIEAGPMVRLTTPAALELYEFPAVDASWTLAVDDPLTGEQMGREVEIENGQATVTDCSVGAKDADGAVGIGTLSQLAVGAITVEDAQRLGTLDLREPIAESLTAVFEKQPVSLAEFF